MRKIRVLVVDGSALMRETLSQVLAADRDIEVVGTAADSASARHKLAALSPDVLTLGVETSDEDEVAFLGRLMQTHPVPVVMISSVTDRGAKTSLRAHELGAFEYVTKPKIDIQRATADLASEIVSKVKAAARSTSSGARSVRIAPAAAGRLSSATALARTTEKVIVIGASTGGTEAILDVLEAMPSNSPPIVIVQHMPPVVTRQFAERLDGLCRVRVAEARDGDELLSGHALIAPGGDSHLEIVWSGARYGVRLVKGPPVGHHRPSVDVMFESCARAAGPNAVAAILTGMGADGARGMLAMRRAGAKTIAEDESTCVVFGMPKEAIAFGGVELVLPLDRIAAALIRAAH